MSMLSYPDYAKLEKISGFDFSAVVGKYNLLKCYSAFKVNFKFPSEILFPNLPVSLNDSTIIFPTCGTTYCTGIELMLAHSLGCSIQIVDGIIIPFKTRNESATNTKTDTDPDTETDRPTYVCVDVIKTFVEEYSKKLKNYKRNIHDIDFSILKNLDNEKLSDS